MPYILTACGGFAWELTPRIRAAGYMPALPALPAIVRPFFRGRAGRRDYASKSEVAGMVSVSVAPSEEISPARSAPPPWGGFREVLAIAIGL